MLQTKLGTNKVGPEKQRRNAEAQTETTFEDGTTDGRSVKIRQPKEGGLLMKQVSISSAKVVAYGPAVVPTMRPSEIIHQSVCDSSEHKTLFRELRRVCKNQF